MADGNNFLSQRWGRLLATVTGPLWLPIYWLVQLVVAFVGICYYLVIERTQSVVFGRAINRTRVQLRWWSMFLIPALPFALALQLFFEMSSSIVWWHRSLGRWQWGRPGVWSAVAAIVFELTCIVVFIGSYYHPLPWKLALYPDCPQMWYRKDIGGEPVRRLLTGPAAFGVLILLVIPTLNAVLKTGRLRKDLFYPFQIAGLAALYTTLFPRDPEDDYFNWLWLTVAGAMLGLLILVGLMILARRVIQGSSAWRQFVWFSAVSLLEKKRIALFSLVAVCLCTAMLLIIVSIMSGFVDQVREKTHGLVGDIIMEGDQVRGFPFYEEFLDQLKSEPLNKTVEYATPSVSCFGLLKVPRWDDLKAETWTPYVRVSGIDLAGKVAVSDFGKALNRYGADAKSVVLAEAPRLCWGREAKDLPGLIYSLDMLAERDSEGKYDRYINKPDWPCMLTVIPVTGKGNILDMSNPAVTKSFAIVDDARTGVYDIDRLYVYVDFHVLQRLLEMQKVEPEAGFAGQPARVHEIQIKLKPGVKLNEGRDIVQEAWYQYRSSKAGMVDNALDKVLFEDVRVETWEEVNAKFISAVENEKRLMVILLGVISIVAVFLILCIFYMIVVEKTRDIGILKSIGASSMQIGSIFLAYAAVIGLVGSLVGTFLGWWFVLRIHEIETFLIHVFGWRVWNREVYAFDQIPNQVDPHDAMKIIVAAILASVIGAIIPAIRAARMNPVEALRYE